MLTIQNISKAFARNKVLTDINLTIHKGDMVAIIGPNGCGKSTLFNIITGALSADSGSVVFDDIELTNLKPQQIAQLGMLRKFQVPGVYSDLSVLEHLQLSFTIQKKAINNQNSQRIQTLAQKMQLQPLLHSKASVLSTGQKQWLELAMLCLLEPKILLLDEPIAGMSHDEANTTKEILHSLNADGLTIVTIEHNIDFVRSLTSDIVVMMNGVVHMRDSYENITNDSLVQENYLGSLYV